MQNSLQNLIDAAKNLCDEMARDGYMNAKLEAARELREALVEYEQEQNDAKPDNHEPRVRIKEPRNDQ